MLKFKARLAAMSRRAAVDQAERSCGRVHFFGGAVWGVFRENANCGDPPGTLPVPSGYPPGYLYISPGPNLENPAKSGKIWAKSSKISFFSLQTSEKKLSKLAKFGEKISKIFSDF